MGLIKGKFANFWQLRILIVIAIMTASLGIVAVGNQSKENITKLSSRKNSLSEEWEQNKTRDKPQGVTSSPTPISDSNNYYSWPVIPIGCIPGDPDWAGNPKIIKNLLDGTYIYQRPDGSLFRGNENPCR